MKIDLVIEDNVQKIGKLLDGLVILLNTYGGKYSIETNIKLEEKKQEEEK